MAPDVPASAPTPKGALLQYNWVAIHAPDPVLMRKTDFDSGRWSHVCHRFAQLLVMPSECVYLRATCERPASRKRAKRRHYVRPRPGHRGMDFAKREGHITVAVTADHGCAGFDIIEKRRGATGPGTVHRSSGCAALSRSPPMSVTCWRWRCARPFYDATGHLVGAGTFQHADEKPAGGGAHAPKPNGIPFTITAVPADAAISADMLSIPVLVNE